MDKRRYGINLLLIAEALLLIGVLVLGIFGQVAGVIRDTQEGTHSQVNREPSEDSEDDSEPVTEPTETGSEPDSGTEPDDKNEIPVSAAAQAMVAEMTTEQKVAQLFVVSPEALTGYEQVTVFGNASKKAYDKCPVGGLVFSEHNYQNDTQWAKLLSETERYTEEKYGRKAFTIKLGEEKKLQDMKLVLSANSDEAGCVAAIQADADILYMPTDFTKAYQAVLKAVNDGGITAERLNEVVGRILTAKGIA